MSGKLRRQMVAAASYLLDKQNPKSGGWGLNTVGGLQTATIVNTTEALFSIKRAGLRPYDPERLIKFYRWSIEHHPVERGDRIRYFTHTVWGLLEFGLPPTDPFVVATAEKIEARCVDSLGWPENANEKTITIWPTFLSLWNLGKVFGYDYIYKKYHSSFEYLLNGASEHNYQWGLLLDTQFSLAATSYLLMLLTSFQLDQSLIVKVKRSVLRMLNRSIAAKAYIDDLAIPGANWHHYSYCWSLKALHSIQDQIDEETHEVTLKVLKYISEELFLEEGGFREPDIDYLSDFQNNAVRRVCNVSSNFNNILAIDAAVSNPGSPDYDSLI